MQYSAEYKSPLGDIIMSGEEDMLCGLWFSGQKYFPKVLPLKKEMPIFRTAREWLDIYFSGSNPGFSVPVKLSGTDFQNKVWKILCKIPYGETITYGEIAKIIIENNGHGKMSAQAIGGAVGHNNISIIIPCHRVVGANGNLTGYAGGIERKKKLLRLEGIYM